MAEALIVGLPSAPDGGLEAHWWLARDGALVERGIGAEWPARAVAADRLPLRVIGLAPAGDVRVAVHEADGEATPRQRAALARLAALEQSLGDPETLHAVSSVPLDGEAVMTAVAANSAMLQWIDWAAAAGVELDRIVPSAALLPRDERWVSATIGGERLAANRGLLIPYEPALAELLVREQGVAELEPERIEAAIAAAAETPLLDLRVGRFAKRRRLVLDRDRIRELVILAALIPLITLLWAVMGIVRLDDASDRLDAQSLQIAESALGRPVTLETAEAELRQRGGASGSSFTASAAGLFQHLQRESGVSSTELRYSADGTLSAGLASPSIDPINRMLVALQRDGYRITAVPRQATDGRAMVDITVRGTP